jgi:hypothetical protein
MKGITMKTKTLFLPVAMSLVASILFIGCSTTAWMSKKIADASNVEKGNQVTVMTRGGHTFTGEYVALREIPMDEYVNIYQESISNSSLGQILPRYGEYIIVSTSAAPDKYWEGQFISFDANHISVKFKGESKPEKVFISGLNSLANSRGKSLQRMQFRQLFQGGDIMLRSALVLDTSTGSIEIPLNTIEKITTPTSVRTQIANDAEKNGYSSSLHLAN